MVHCLCCYISVPCCANCNCCKGWGCGYPCYCGQGCGCNLTLPCCGLGFLLCPAAAAAYLEHKKRKNQQNIDSKAEPLTHVTMEERDVDETETDDKPRFDDEN
mmetsp:Transcript_30385/g.33709  ORF Transcript_30385/g.33709 Transcript_30385/m.33709 type:complete len:103 (-) Transcript_30385:299-607(-)